MNTRYDLIVIGAGAAGITAASIAHTLGAKTLLIEKNKIGGDCTWFGCIPSKTLLKSAAVAQHIKTASRFGIDPESSRLTAARVMDHVRDTIAEIAHTETPEVFRKKGIDITIGTPRFTGQNTLDVNGEEVLFKKCILSTGSRPVIPPVSGIEKVEYLTNETIFSLKSLPRELLILGGGPIGIELAQSLSRLGVKVFLVEMADRILFREEKELARYLEKKLKSEGVTFFTSHKAVQLRNRDDKISLTLESAGAPPREIVAEKILVATGRSPRIDGLDLEKAHVHYTKKRITVNAYLRTTGKNIFACGDVIGPYQFSHMANYQAHIAVRNALFKRIAWQKADNSNVSWAIFTDPELAHCGLTEEEALARNKKIKVYTTDYSECDRAVTDQETEGMIKIIVDQKGYLSGAHVVGASAGEIIHPLIVARALKIPVARLSRLVYIYPVLSELIKKTAQKPMLDSLNNPFIRWTMNILRQK
ncbi:MAG: FAD-dependent oxidoreductase [Candidatus Omnitrophica bacterium]|nr:FAD-dependent oxidoreductase [Candidatus Omnitrophota bacterium]